MPATPQILAPSPLTVDDGRPAISAWTLDPQQVHINHGSFGAVPREVQALQNEYRARMDSEPLAWFPALPELVKGARESIAAFVGTNPEHTALVPNASAGASVVYNSITLKQGAEILVTNHGYGAVTMGAERIARRAGGSVRTAYVPLGATAEEAHAAVVAEMNGKTGLVVIDQITSPTARRLPVDTIVAEARLRGIPTLVDAAHVPGLYENPADGIDADFWVGNLHKFACAPRGTAVLVARSELREELYPLIDSWGAPEPFPNRFDTQGTLDQTSYLAAPASFAFIEKNWGWQNARTYMSDLADYAENVIANAFQEITGENHKVDLGMPVNGLRLVRLPHGLATIHPDANELRDRTLSELGLACAFTNFDGHGYYRLSTHVYNTAADFDAFVERCIPALIRWSREARAA